MIPNHHDEKLVQQKVYSLYISMFKNNMLTGFFWEGLVVCASMAKLLLSASQAPFSPSLCYKDGEELLRVPVRGHRPKNTDKSCNTALLVDWALLGGFSQDRCKWLISMLSFRPLTGVVGPLPKGLNGSQMLNYLLIGMILEVELCHLLLPFPSLKLAPEIWWERNTFSCLFGAKGLFSDAFAVNFREFICAIRSINSHCFQILGDRLVCTHTVRIPFYIKDI